MLTFEYCRNVKVKENLLVGNVLGADVAINGMDKDNIHIGLDQGIILHEF